MTLSLAASAVLLVVLIAAAVAASLFVYRRTVPEISRARRAVLVTLRALGLALLLFLLFEPVLNLRRDTTLAPRTLVLVDDSRSLTIEDRGTPRSALVRQLVDDGTFAPLLRDERGAAYAFTGGLRPIAQLEADSLHFAGGQTDIAAAMGGAAERERDRNLRAIVLVTDGNSTAGGNPLHVMSALGLPVYVIGVGDTAERKDLLVSRVLANDMAYVGTEVPLDVTVRSAGFPGGSMEVSVSEDGRTFATQRVALLPGVNEYPLSFTYTPKSEGVRKLAVRIAPQAGELTERNNRRSFFMRVRRSKMRVALIAGAPSPDVALFHAAMHRDANLEIISYVRKSPAAWYGAAPDARALQGADCIVLVGPPTGPQADGVLQLVRAATAAGRPLMIVPARETDWTALRDQLGDVFPLDVVQERREETQVFFQLTPDGAGHPVTATGIPGDAWKRLPPLFRTESGLRPRVGALSLGTMSINSITFAEPLLVSRRLHNSRVLLWTAYGLWRWELATEVLDGRLPDLLVSNAVRWLTTREDERRVRIRPDKEFFDSGEPLGFNAQVYDESFDPVNDAVVTVTVSHGGAQRSLQLEPQGAGRYRGAIDAEGEGDYTYTGNALAGGKDVGKDAGRFAVGEANAEFQETRRNGALLAQLAAQSGGRLFDARDVRGLADSIARHPGFTPSVAVVQSDLRLWNMVWLLAAAILCFAVEWFLRKRAGMV